MERGFFIATGQKVSERFDTFEAAAQAAHAMRGVRTRIIQCYSREEAQKYVKDYPEFAYNF